MKIKDDFITNSSSTAFIIYNNSGKDLNLVDFVKENPQLIKEYITEYTWQADDARYSQETLIKSAEANNEHFDPGEERYCVFGDEDGTIIGNVFDYILRGGGESQHFKWRYEEALR